MADHSHTDEAKDVYEGMVGMFVILAPGKATSALRPVDVKKEFFIFMQVFDEGFTHSFDYNFATYANSTASSDPDDFNEANHKYSINGYSAYMKRKKKSGGGKK